MTIRTVTDAITALVAPIVSDLKLDLYDLEFNGGLLKITVDTLPGSESGITLDQLALVTRLVGRDLDHHDPIPGHYTLEVSSPGLERKLRTPEHFAAALGKQVRVRTVAGTEGERRVEGELTAADEHGVVLATPDGERRIAYDEVERARTVFEWGPTPPPGGGRQRRQKVAAGSKRKDTK